MDIRKRLERIRFWTHGEKGFSPAFSRLPTGSRWIRVRASILCAPSARAITFELRGNIVAPLAKGHGSGASLLVRCGSAPALRFPLPRVGNFLCQGLLSPQDKSTPLEIEIEGLEKADALTWIERWTRPLPLPRRLKRRLACFRNNRFRRRIRFLSLHLDGIARLDFSTSQISPDLASLRPTPNGVNIVGFLQGTFGTAEAARLGARMIEAARIPHTPIPLETHQEDHPRTPPHSVTLSYLDTMDVAKLPASWRRNRYTIGYWHWEMARFPENRLDAFLHVDEIWVPSRFVFDALLPLSPVPLQIIPHAIPIREPAPLNRAEWNLPNDAFLFLIIYDLHSVQQRKNPQAGIRAFLRAFGTRTDVHLLVKSQNADAHPAEYADLTRQISGHANISLLAKTLSRDELHRLQSQADALISLHRSEGFGLVPAEMMALGKPVVATHWSATAEFMNAENSCPVSYKLQELEHDIGPFQKGELWAEANVEETALILQKLASDPNLCRRIGTRARETISTHFSIERIGKLCRTRLQHLALLRPDGVRTMLF